MLSKGQYNPPMPTVRRKNEDSSRNKTVEALDSRKKESAKVAEQLMQRMGLDPNEA